jgi:hypothetical protein
MFSVQLELVKAFMSCLVFTILVLLKMKMKMNKNTFAAPFVVKVSIMYRTTYDLCMLANKLVRWFLKKRELSEG